MHFKNDRSRQRLPQDNQRRQSTSAASQDDQKWISFCENVKKNMSGSEQEKEAILRKRILKNFQDYKLQSDLFYTRRRDIDPYSVNLQVISEASLFIFGIDFMSESAVKHYFRPFQVQINIYDESHCQIKFQNAKQLMQSLYSKLIQKPESLNALYSTYRGNHGEMVVWRQVAGYTQMTVQRRLWARFATTYDYAEKRQNNCRTKIQAFEIAKAQFLNRQTKFANNSSSTSQNRFGVLGRINRDRPRQSAHATCCCKVNKLVELLSCSHNCTRCSRQSSPKRQRSLQSSGRERTRDKRHKNSRELKGLKQLSKPLALIEEITNPSLTTKSNRSTPKEPIEQLQCSIAPIAHKEELDQSKDKLFLDMLQEFSRYSPFSGTAQSKGSKNISSADVSQSMFSYYECGSDNEQ